MYEPRKAPPIENTLTREPDLYDHLLWQLHMTPLAENVREIAEMIRDTLGGDIPIVTTPTDDVRSYHVSSRKIKEELGFEAKHSVEEAILDLKEALDAGKILNPMTDIRYYNIKTMQHINLR